ncbi:MAG TPA: TetR/AcrR family transcriptional regulator [Candidatus Bathyarchaeia archaeon]|nr:TetR/AcrR family transcriptional regulator [Candidatus Bathyarchaeia archaeon]
MKTASNRTHAIVVASDLFLKRGLVNTSIDDVVKESGVSKSNIYYHFKSKEELIVAVLNYRISMFQETVHTILLTDLSFKERMRLIFTSLAEELDGRSCVGGCPILAMLAFPMPELRSRINRFFVDLREMVEGMLIQGVATKEFRADIPISQTADLVITSIEGSLMLAEAHGDSSVVAKSGEALLHLLQV